MTRGLRAAVCLLGVLCFASLSVADTPVLDVDGDGVADTIVAFPSGSPDPDATGLPGYVEIRSGVSNDLLERLVGDRADDHFGATTLVTHDVTGDGALDVVVGAPGANLVAIYSVPSLAWSDGDIGLHRATAVIEITADFAREFGMGVYPLFDADGHGVADLQVAALAP